MQQTSVQKENVLQDKKGGNVMFKQMKKRIKNEKGLTLIELLAVIVILAIVAAIAVPAIGNIIDNSRAKAAKADIVNVLNGANIYFTDNSSATSATKANIDPYVESYGNFTLTSANRINGTTTVSGSLVVGSTTYTVTNATLQDIKPNLTTFTEQTSVTGTATDIFD